MITSPSQIQKVTIGYKKARENAKNILRVVSTFNLSLNTRSVIYF